MTKRTKHEELTDEVVTVIWDVIHKALELAAPTTELSDYDKIRLNCAFLDEVCVGCTEDCPCAEGIKE